MWYQWGTFWTPPAEVPLIIVATGTGIAPFRGVIFDRKKMGAKENTVLIFGCRNKTEDFYYNYEFKDIQLIPAFSRENIQKVYV